MADQQKPIIFLAFANPERDLDINLEIRLFEELLDNHSEFEYRPKFAASAQSIYDFFKNPQQRGRICIFHYAGHANKDSLLLNDKLTHGETLGNFLALQVGLQLVVLNACETQNLGDLIVKKGIPTVIATNQPVKDLKASRFTRNFYENLLSGSTVEKSFQNAISVFDSVPFNLSIVRGLDTGKKIPVGLEYISLYNQEDDKSWTLAETLSDPYFGLPKLPPTAYDNLPEVPFIGLKHFGKSTESNGKVIDTSPLFFGRAKSIREIIVSVEDPARKLILLYGKSGVGKSSLLAAGVEGRLKQAGYASIYLRRSSKGLAAILAEALQCTDKDYQKAWIEVENRVDRPLIVILDQAEEAITNHRPEEIEAMADALIHIFNIAKVDEYTGESIPSPIRGKLILGYREEFHGQIENVFRQKGIPTEKILIEPLTPDSIEEIVTGIPKDERLRKEYKLIVDNGVSERIKAKLSEDNTDAISPVLQLLLTKMWGESKPSMTGERVFSLSMLDNLLKQGIWLKDFVEQQLVKIEKFYPNQVNSGLVLDVLHTLTTDIATAKAASTSSILDRYEIDHILLETILKKLEDLYLLATTTVDGEQGYRLSHDTLAPIVRKMFAESILPGQLASRLLSAKDISVSNPFGESDIRILSAGREGMAKWSPEVIKAYNESQSYIEEKIEELIRLKEEAEKQANNAMALYWASEADKILPSQGLRLLEKAEEITKDGKALNFIKEQTEKVFRGNKNHQFKEKKRYKGCIASSANGDWVITRNENDYCQLWGTVSGKKHDLLKNETSIKKATFSTNGTWLYTCTISGESRVWDTRSGQASYFLQDQKDIAYAAFSADGTWLYTRTGSGESRVWDTRSGQVSDFLQNQKDIAYAAFSADGTWLYTRTELGESRVWDTRSGQASYFLQDQKDIIDAEFLADGRWLYTRTRSWESRVWNMRSGQVSDFLKDQKDIAYAIFSTDGTWLYTRTGSGESRVWNMRSGQVSDFLKDQKDIAYAAFSADGTWLYTRTELGESRVWDTRSGQVSDFLKDQKDIIDAEFSADGAWLYTCTTSGECLVWDMHNRWIPVLLLEQNKIEYTSFSADGRWLFSYAKSSSRVWDTRSEREPDFLSAQLGITYAEFSADGTWLFTSALLGGKRVWEVLSGRVPDFLQDQKDILNVIFSDDGKWLLTWTQSKEYRLWDMRNRQRNDFLQDPKGIIDATFSANGAWLLMRTTSGECRVWDTHSGKEHDFLKAQKNIEDARFSPDGDWLLMRTTSGECRVWDTHSGKEHDFLKAQKNIEDARFSPDGDWLLMRTTSGECRVWDTHSGKEHDFLKAQKNIEDARFSPDGDWLLMRTTSGECRVWDTHSGKEHDFLKAQKNIDYAEFSDDGRYLATASNHKIITWDIASGDIIQNLYINTIPPQDYLLKNHYLQKIYLIENRYLYVVAGKAIIKTDIQEQQGNLFSYGDGETLDYTYEEIKEWMQVFGGEYLGPLDQQTREKYNVDETVRKATLLNTSLKR